MIALDEDEAREVIDRSAAMAADVLARVFRRACVLSTGLEVRTGVIRDTTAPYIRSVLEQGGYQVTGGEVLEDDRDLIAGRIRRAVVLAVDPEAESPYILDLTQGTGRHEKDGVWIAVGVVWCTTIVSLPGPNDEVRAALPVLLDALGRGLTKMELASAVAGALKAQLRSQQQVDRHQWEGHRT